METDFIDFISNMNPSLIGLIIFLIVNIVLGLICFGLYKLSGE